MTIERNSGKERVCLACQCGSAHKRPPSVGELDAEGHEANRAKATAGLQGNHAVHEPLEEQRGFDNHRPQLALQFGLAGLAADR